MDELISKQAAIDIAKELIITLDGYEMNNQAVANYCIEITRLPPAQPEQHIDADGTLWITVSDIEQVKRVIVDEDKSKFCRQFYQDAQSEPCEDAVSRLGAISHFRRIADATSSKEKYNEGFIDGLEFCIAHLSTMPPVTPKQRTGKWIDGIIPNDGGGLPVIVCDQCNTFFPLQFGDGHNFCPNCGAKMEGKG